jgi:hypothetical protein
MICCRPGETVVNVETTAATRLFRAVTLTLKNRLAEWHLTQHAHKERARVRDAQVAKTAKTDSFKQTCWLNYCQPESDAARTPDSAARPRRGGGAG